MLARDGKAHAQIVRQTASKAGEGTRSVRRGKRGRGQRHELGRCPRKIQKCDRHKR